MLTAILSVLPFVAYISEQAVPDNRTPPLPQLLAAWQHKGAPEYVPARSIMPIGRPDLPQVAAVDQANAALPNATCSVALEQQAPDLRTLRTASSRPCRLRLALYFYPYWRATDESNQTLATARDSVGLLLIDVPPGAHTVSLRFHPASATRTASAILSLISLLVSMAALILLRPRPDHETPPGTGLRDPLEAPW